MEYKFFSLGAILAGLAVATGAFGAHGLEKIVSAEQLVTWEKAVKYQMYHALGLFIIAWALTQWPEQASTLINAGWAFIIGVALFSGSLYFLVLTGSLKLGPVSLALVTPAGGVAFVLGWYWLMMAAIRAGKM